MAWIAANWAACLSILSMVIGVIVAILHIAGQNGLATSLQNVEDILNKIAGNQVPPAK